MEAEKHAPRRRWAAFGAGAGAAVLAACASVPQPQPARIAKPISGYATRESFAAPAAPWPNDRWWTSYADPQLDHLIDEALTGSPTLAQAKTRVAKALTSRAAAAAAIQPIISGSGNIQETKQTYNWLFPKNFLPALGYQPYGEVLLNFSWELDFWGKYRAAIAQATSEARASAADAAEARLMLSTQIASAYATLAQFYDDRDVAVQSVRVRNETAGLVAQRVTNGIDTQADLKQAQAASPATEETVLALDEQIALTKDALAALLGAGPDRGLQIQRPRSPKVAAFGLPADARLDLIGRRPDVVAARWRAEAAQKGVRVAKAQFYPDISLTGYIGQQSLYLSRLLNAGSTLGSIGPAVTLPILDGGQRRANLRGAEADRDDAVAAYDAAVTEALHQVADAAASERALGDRLTESRRSLAGYEDAWRIARLRYEGGLSTFQSVLLAEDAVLNQRRVVSDLESRAFELDVELVRALGGGFRQS
ncbi:MAG TPA: efflux transporter outer membrane subunit [Caulobacteraceae bacterium]|jgi:NodT family efflux transporter outer membrane factor (OMF) lipoprotein|nr:efflux transporter outer membrane subunit [Caulobacteraceae bacterium]